jgi:hypothetical protein
MAMACVQAEEAVAGVALLKAGLYKRPGEAGLRRIRHWLAQNQQESGEAEEIKSAVRSQGVLIVAPSVRCMALECRAPVRLVAQP